MKRYILSIIICLFSISTGLAQTISTHIIQRGETLLSIARKYGITGAQLQNANPETKDVFFVGMKLIIPTPPKNGESPKEGNVAITKTEPANHPDKLTQDFHKTTQKEDCFYSSKFHVGIYSGLSLADWYGKYIDNTKIATRFHIGLSLSYFFSEDFFTELNIGYATKGYEKDNRTSSGSTWDEDGLNYDQEGTETRKTNNIELSLLMGTGVLFSKGFYIGVKVGPYITNAFSGELNSKGTNTIYPDIHSSETEHYNKTTYLKDWKDYEKFGYGIQGGIGGHFNHISFWATYQMGLSKMIKKKDCHERVIMFTIGYYF